MSSGPDSIPPPSGRISNMPAAAHAPSVRERAEGRILRFVDHMGAIGVLTRRTVASVFKRPLEISATVYQIESLGVRSMGIVAVTSVFVGTSYLIISSA